MEIVYLDGDVLVCVKPAGVLSTDGPGGLPSLLRAALGDETAEVRTVHRLDRMAAGLMVLARSREAASCLSREIREGGFEKEYRAVVHGATPDSGTLTDWLLRDKARKMSFAVDAPGKDVQQARLWYETLWRREELSAVRIRLETGRTHQIRVQFASRGWPLVGERKYSTRDDPCPLALFSSALAFTHPTSGVRMRFEREPEPVWPWAMRDL